MTTEIEYSLNPAANLPQVADSEISAFRLISGEPKPGDIRHLVARVAAQMEPDVPQADIKAAVLSAIAQGRK